MKSLSLGAVLAGIGLVVSSGPVETWRSPSVPDVEPASVSLASAATAVSHPVPAAELTDVVQQYCVICHNDALLTGNLSLQEFVVEDAPGQRETAEKMIRKLRAGMMPPPGMPRPSPDTLMALVESLETQIDEAARATPHLGERRFQRLTRAEYERVIEDLLALDVDAGQWLPPDVLVGAFDNAAAGQVLSTTLLDSFLRAASEVSRLAVGNPDAVSASAKYTNPLEVSQHPWDRIEGAPFGTRGGMVVTHDFPADGEYIFEVETTLGGGNEVSMEDVDISIDGEPVAQLMLEHNGGTVVSGVMARGYAGTQTEPIFIRAGQHQVSAAFINLIEGPYEDRFSAPAWSHAGTEGGQYGITGLTHLTQILITGPKNPVGVSETASRREIFTCHPGDRAEARPCAESIITRLASEAYRGPVPAAKLVELMEFYDESAAKGGFEVGIRTALMAILASPEFVFRFEKEPAGTEPGQDYRLGDMDLATRLSFFLWAASPDEELVELAETGRLSDPAVLDRQVDRMLKDPRSQALASRFAHQWLRLQGVGKVWPEAYLYPDFSEQLAEALIQETELFFDDLVRENRSMLELFSADYTFVNERLAEHYGMEGISGEAFRKVRYPNDQRQGILGHASVLHLTSMSDRTSPVLRGKWVMEVLMGTPPPPPPPNVPAFESSASASQGRRLTTRERMEIHRAAPVCNSCHSFIDPIGLALDNYDVTGAWRVRENMAPLDTRGTFYDGTEIGSPIDLANVLLSRPIPLVRNFTERLLEYAIGRPADYMDQPTVRAIARGAAEDGYKMQSLIKGVVQSDPFLMRQAQATAN